MSLHGGLGWLVLTLLGGVAGVIAGHAIALSVL